jgi:hypothetical protein
MRHQPNRKKNPFISRSLIRRNYKQGRNSQVPDELLATIVTLQKQGIEGDHNAVQKAFDILEEIRLFYPTNHLVEAYYGSVLTLLGRDALEPMERLEKVRNGLKFMDNAVQNEPDNIDIRIIRGYVCLRLPEVFFHRTQTAVDDFTYIITRYETEPNIISDTFYRKILRDLKQAYRTLGRDPDANSIQQKIDLQAGYEGGESS